MPHTPAPGDKVRVTDGPFLGHEAVIRAIAADHLKLDVTANTLTIPITVHPHQIERTEEAA